MLRIKPVFSFLFLCGLLVITTPLAAQDYDNQSSSKTKVLRPSKRVFPQRAPSKRSSPSRSKKQLIPSRTSSKTATCSTRRSILENEQEKLDGYRANLTGINVEINQLKKRLRELRSQAKAVKRQSKAQSSRVSRIKKVYERECKKSENCSQYEQTATNLENQSRPVEENIATVRKEIRQTRQDINTLQKRIQPLQTDYTQYRCSNQVPGRTSQATIDRCYSIFSEWNQLQALLNRHNARLPQLKTEYERYMAQLTNIENHAKRIEVYLARNCQQSPKTKTISSHKKVRQNAQQLGSDLDRLIKDINKLKKLKITVQR